MVRQRWIPVILLMVMSVVISGCKKNETAPASGIAEKYSSFFITKDKVLSLNGDYLLKSFQSVQIIDQLNDPNPKTVSSVSLEVFAAYLSKVSVKNPQPFDMTGFRWVILFRDGAGDTLSNINATLSLDDRYLGITIFDDKSSIIYEKIFSISSEDFQKLSELVSVSFKG